MSTSSHMIKMSLLVIMHAGCLNMYVEDYEVCMQRSLPYIGCDVDKNVWLHAGFTFFIFLFLVCV